MKHKVDAEIFNNVMAAAHEIKHEDSERDREERILFSRAQKLRLNIVSDMFIAIDIKEVDWSMIDSAYKEITFEVEQKENRYILITEDDIELLKKFGLMYNAVFKGLNIGINTFQIVYKIVQI